MKYKSGLYNIVIVILIAFIWQIGSFSARASDDSVAYNKTYFDNKEVVDAQSPIPLQILPKDKNGVVNWSTAVDDGYIKPLGVLNADISADKAPYDLDVRIKSDEGTPSGVVFSHRSHTYWFNCNACHPGLYGPKYRKAGNASSVKMAEMNKGASCGRCHSKVAFSLDNCSRCHTDKRL